MRQIELEKSKKAWVSFQEIPELVLPEYESMYTVIASNDSGLNERRTFILELLLPANSSYYVILGAKYAPNEECRNLHVEARFRENNTKNIVQLPFTSFYHLKYTMSLCSFPQIFFQPNYTRTTSECKVCTKDFIYIMTSGQKGR